MRRYRSLSWQERLCFCFQRFPLFWPERRFFIPHLFEIPHCFTQIAEVLDSFLGQSQLLQFFVPFSCFFVAFFRCPFSSPSSGASCCAQSDCWVFRCPTPSFGSRRSCPTRSKRMFTFRCGGKKRGTQVRWGPACALRLGVPRAVSRLQPLQASTSRQPPQRLWPKQHPQLRAQGAAARNGVLHPTKVRTTRALAPAASDFPPWISCSSQPPPPA